MIPTQPPIQHIPGNKEPQSQKTVQPTQNTEKSPTQTQEPKSQQGQDPKDVKRPETPEHYTPPVHPKSGGYAADGPGS